MKYPTVTNGFETVGGVHAGCGSASFRVVVKALSLLGIRRLPIFEVLVDDFDWPLSVLPWLVAVTPPRCRDGRGTSLEIEGAAFVETHVRVEWWHVGEEVVRERGVHPIGALAMSVTVVLRVDDERRGEDATHGVP